jgi:hypothetical protein
VKLLRAEWATARTVQSLFARNLYVANIAYGYQVRDHRPYTVANSSQNAWFVALCVAAKRLHTVSSLSKDGCQAVIKIKAIPPGGLGPEHSVQTVLEDSALTAAPFQFPMVLGTKSALLQCYHVSLFLNLHEHRRRRTPTVCAPSSAPLGLSAPPPWS